MNGGVLFTVVIPTCQREELLAKCLERLSLGRQSFPGDKYEVIVSDDSPTGATQEMVTRAFPWVTWVAGPRCGPASNRNNGAKYARGRWIVFLDDDCVPDLEILAAYAEAISLNPSTLVFEGRIYADRPQISLAETAPLNGKGGYLWSCNFAISKDAFVALRGFDERFPYAAMEDVEFSHRIKKQGVPSLFVHSAAVCHPWKSRNSLKEVNEYEASFKVFINLHPEEQPAFSGMQLLLNNVRRLLKETLPGAVEYRGKGLILALTWHFYTVGTAWRAWRRDRKRPR